MKQNKNKWLGFKCLANGFKLSAGSIQQIVFFWIIFSILIAILTIPAASTLGMFFGSSDIFAALKDSVSLQNYLKMDILTLLKKNNDIVFNPYMIVFFFILSILITCFFTAGLIGSYVDKIKEHAKDKKYYSRTKNKEFFQTALKYFFPFLIIFIFGLSLLWILNILTENIFAFLNSYIWNTFHSEAAVYYFANIGVKILYYILFFFIAIYLQYIRIAYVLNYKKISVSASKPSLRQLLQESIFGSFLFIIRNIGKVVVLSILFVLLNCIIFTIDHFVFYNVLDTYSGYYLLIWTIVTGGFYCYIRFWGYASAALLLGNLKK